MQLPAQIQKGLINITASKYFLESCHKYLIHYLGNLNEMTNFLQTSPRKIENLVKVGELENFTKKKKRGGGACSGPNSNGDDNHIL